MGMNQALAKAYPRVSGGPRTPDAALAKAIRAAWGVKDGISEHASRRVGYMGQMRLADRVRLAFARDQVRALVAALRELRGAAAARERERIIKLLDERVEAHEQLGDWYGANSLDVLADVIKREAM